MYVKPTDSDLRNGEMLKAFLQDKDTTVTNFIQHSTGSPSQSNQTRKNKDSNWKEVKLLLLADDVVLFTENPKDSSRKLPEIINE